MFLGERYNKDHFKCQRGKPREQKQKDEDTERIKVGKTGEELAPNAPSKDVRISEPLRIAKEEI